MQKQSELPEGWIITEVSNIGNIITGKTPPKKDKTLFNGEIPFFKPRDLNKGYYVMSSQDTLTKKGLDYVKILPPLTVMVTCIGATIGKTGLSRTEGTTNQQINSIVIKQDTISPNWIYHVFTSNWMQIEIHKRSSVTTLPIINKSRFSKLPVPIPPLAEQHRIVSAIEALFARLDAADKRLDRVPDILKKFRQSVLAAACDGKLTEGWRKENPAVEDGSSLIDQIKKKHNNEGKGHGGKAALPTNGIHVLDIKNFPKSWGIDELKWICKPGRSITYGILKPGPHQINGIPYIRVADFPNDKIILSKIKRTTSEIANNYKRSVLDYGDILLSIRGTVGRVCRVPQELQGSNVTQDTARISVSEEMNVNFVEMYLRSPNLQKRLEKAIKGVAIRGVNIGDVRALQIIIPSLPEQHEIVRRVDALFALADSIEAKVSAARERTEKMRQSVLSKAFSGELVETEAELARRECRDYEPADVLLERIKAERVKIGKKGKAAK